MSKVRVCGPSSARSVVMKRVWREVKEIEARGEFADFGKVVDKHWLPMREKLAKKICFDEEV